MLRIAGCLRPTVEFVVFDLTCIHSSCLLCVLGWVQWCFWTVGAPLVLVEYASGFVLVLETVAAVLPIIASVVQ